MRSRYGVGNTVRLKPPEDGIVTSTRGGWLKKRWDETLEAMEGTHGDRLSRGRQHARGGRVRDLWMSPGLASAQVVAEEVYEVSLRFTVLEEEEWTRVVEALTEHLGQLGDLIEGHLPPELVEQLQQRGLSLLPSESEMEGDCGCDDYMFPCAHMVAVHQVVAEALDGAPFGLFTLRGRDRDTLLDDVRRVWGEQRDAPLRESEAPPRGGDWFEAPVAMENISFRYRVPTEPGVGLVCLGPAPDRADLLRPLTPLYEAGGRRALEIVMNEVRTPEPVRVAPVVAPPEPPKSSRLTEALVDLLAEGESLGTPELAERLDVTVVEVRKELRELEDLGLVYRTGQTRGTRWSLG